MPTTIKPIEAIFERGYLRPLQPLEASEGAVYLVTLVEAKADKLPSGPNLRGKYRGYLSTTAEFSQNKQAERELEF